MHPSSDQIRPDERTSDGESVVSLRHGVLLLLLILTWAASWPVIKIGVGQVTPLWFSCLRYSIATALMFIVVGSSQGWARPHKADWPLILVSGALQMGAYAALTGFALVSLPPGRASVLAFSTPIWVVPLAAVWLDERITARAFAGIALGIAGVLAIAAPSIVLSEAWHLFAYLALMGASLTWAVSIVFVRRHRFVSNALALAPWQMLVAALLLLPIALLLEGPPPALDPTGLSALAFAGPISTGFGYWAVVEAGRHFRAGTMSMALLATPSLGILISAMTLGESVDAQLLAGVAMVGVGICLTTVASRLPSGAACTRGYPPRRQP